MNSYKVPAVVIGGGINGLGVMRNLGRNGIDVFCAVDEESDIAIYSKYCKGYIVCPNVENDLHTIDDFLTKFEERIINKAALFPTSDVSVLNVSKLIAKLSKYEIVMPAYEVLETLIVKQKFYESLEKRGIPHPTTLYPDRENFEDLKIKLRFPVFVKPSVSPIFAEKFPGRKGFTANSEKELRYYLSLMKKNQIDLIIQEIVQGPIENFYSIGGYVDNNSKPMILFAMHRVRAPTLFDNPTAVIDIPISEVPEIKEIVVKYLSSIKYRGIFLAEFKLDSHDKVFKFLEVNARSWMSNTYPTACGANMILTAYLEAIGEKVKPIAKYETGIYNIHLLRDLVTIFSKNVDLNQRFQWRKRIKSYIEKKHYIDYARDDRKPFLKSLLNLLTYLIR